MATDIKPYSIQVPDSAMDSLKEKLGNATFASQAEFSDDWDSGAPLSDVKRLAAYWRDGFDWRAQEAKLNRRAASPIASLYSSATAARPGNFLEALKILPLLTESETGPSFHVVAPSLPNFGFSDGVTKRGFSIPQYAETVHKLMLKLGYDKYVTQGGDWGYPITRLVGVQYPENCMASHVNMVHATGPPAFTKTPWQYLVHLVSPYSADEKKGMSRSEWFRREGHGYAAIQTTKPSTLGFALADSPVALLAWIYEKLHDWTDNYPWTDDEILTWISIYQFSKAGPAANIRIYYEYKHTSLEQIAKAYDYVPNVPLGLSYFPRELVLPPKTWGRTLGPVVFEETHTSGGHFAAHEKPEELVQDLKKMFGENGGAFKVAQQFQSKL
ncbi:hypothetical protein F66182_1157 [Fusarium sp. NRRL 66182]|nr:hypothetical protein F66182_1157 [Fusarium sp. NRRL 66182]